MIYQGSVLAESIFAKLSLCPKINLAVSSIEFCQALFDEGNIGKGLGGGGGHTKMIPSL
jgi:hypothetical protein